jgi:hypothetical protein
MVFRDESVVSCWSENCRIGERQTVTARARFGADAEETET